jgi:hypothetical protein
MRQHSWLAGEQSVERRTVRYTIALCFVCVIVLEIVGYLDSKRGALETGSAATAQNLVNVDFERSELSGSWIRKRAHVFDAASNLVVVDCHGCKR